jgi:hypothetical protein
MKVRLMQYPSDNNEKTLRKRGSHNKWISLACSFIALSGLGYGVLTSYLGGAGFAKFLSSKLSLASGMESQIEGIKWLGLSLSSDHFTAKNGTVLQSLYAKNLHSEIGFGSFYRGKWEIKKARISQLNLNFNSPQKKLKGIHPTKAAIQTMPNKPDKTKASRPPKKWEIKSLELEDLRMQFKADEEVFQTRGTRVSLKSLPGNQNYQYELSGGTVLSSLDWLPELHIKQIEGSWQNEQLEISNAKISGWEKGELRAQGMWNRRTKDFSLNGRIDGVSCSDLFQSSENPLITGELSTSFSLSKSNSHGELHLEHGLLHYLSFLEIIGDKRLTHGLAISEANTKWSFTDERWIFEDISINSHNLIRLKGSIIMTDEQIDGTLLLGLAREALSRAPQAVRDLFALGEDELFWTPVRLSGSPKKMKFDLTERLIKASLESFLEPAIDNENRNQSLERLLRKLAK